MVDVSFIINNQQRMFLSTDAVPLPGELISLNGTGGGTYRVSSRHWYHNLDKDRQRVDVFLDEFDMRHELSKAAATDGT